MTVTTTLSNAAAGPRERRLVVVFPIRPEQERQRKLLTVPGNNNPSPRDANIIVSVEGGPAAIHTIHQERPVGCVYRDTGKARSGAGGTGSFTVTTIPGDCQWKITDTWFGVQITGPTTATGAATVTYIVEPNGSVFDQPFRVQGLSG